jgi:hypothetical protein
MRRSGGAIYHWRAFKHGKMNSHALWAQHRERVEHFLSLWNPQGKNLVLIGPSGGYSLPPAFLDRFENVIGVEPDAMARFIFEKRFSKNVNWIKEGVDFANLDPLQKLIPADSVILFCNLLGQLTFRRAGGIKKNLAAFLKSYTWASYHDALSGEGLEFDTELSERGKEATLAKMKSWIYPKVSGGTLEVNAHQAPDLFSLTPDAKFYYWQWRITPKRTHLIEGVFHVKTEN